jgi:hypothetical protein
MGGINWNEMMARHPRMTRRRALAAVTATIATTMARARAVQAGGLYAGLLIDAHTHLRPNSGTSIHDLIALYDASGVRGVLLFGEPWPIATEARDSYPDRVVPFLAEGYANAVHPHSSYVNPAGLEQLLSGNFVRGMGEVILRHSPYQLGASGGFASAPANNVPADHPALIEAYRLAGRFGAPVNVHQEWFFAAELERALTSAPETVFVWAHAGHGPAPIVRGVLERNPNLMADLSARTPWIGPGTVLLRLDGLLDPVWNATLHDLADRFVIGLDLFAPAHYEIGYVSRMVAYYRDLLGQLDPHAADLIGHANAERIAPFGAS